MIELDRLLSSLKGYVPKLENRDHYFEAAVFIPIVETIEGPTLLFQVRSSELEWQPGEICFPGGKIEKTDASTAAAALRETQEELGLCPEDLELYGELDYFVSPLGLIIHPVIGKILHPEKIVPCPGEVAEVFTVPLAWFAKTEPQRGKIEVATRPGQEFPFELVPPSYQKDWRNRSGYEVQFYPYDQWVIWGLTARILEGFLEKIGLKIRSGNKP